MWQVFCCKVASWNCTFISAGRDSCRCLLLSVPVDLTRWTDAARTSESVDLHHQRSRRVPTVFRRPVSARRVQSFTGTLDCAVRIRTAALQLKLNSESFQSTTNFPDPQGVVTVIRNLNGLSHCVPIENEHRQHNAKNGIGFTTRKTQTAADSWSGARSVTEAQAPTATNHSSQRNDQPADIRQHPQPQPQSQSQQQPQPLPQPQSQSNHKPRQQQKQQWQQQQQQQQQQ